MDWDSDPIRAGIAKVRQQAAWYRMRLREAADRIAILDAAIGRKETVEPAKQMKRPLSPPPTAPNTSDDDGRTGG